MFGNRLLGLASAVFVSVCATMPAASEPFRLILTHLEPPLVPNSVMDLAVDLGYFEREGVQVELIRVQQTPSAIAAVFAGEGDMANVGVDALVQLVARGTPGLWAVASPNKSLPFVIAAREGITTPQDLAGRSFGVGRVGSLDHSLSMKVLQAAGLDTERLDILSLGQPPVRAQALAAGQVDATTMSIGVWLSLPDKTGVSLLVEQADYYAAAPVINKVNIVTEETLAKRREDVVAVLRALVHISRDFAAEPDLWAAAMAGVVPNTTPEMLRELAATFDGAWSVNGGMNRNELQFTQDWLYETTDFEGLPRVSLDQWVDFSVMGEVLAEIGLDDRSDFLAR